MGGLTTLMRVRARHLQSRGAGERLDTRVDETDGRAPRCRLGGEDAARQRERAAVTDAGEAQAHEVDLTHELVGDGELEARIRQVFQAGEGRLARRAHEGVEISDRLVQKFPGPIAESQERD
jgi:hypothetical protein